MMHLEAIKRRNAKPAPQPTRDETLSADYDHRRALVVYRRVAVTPSDAPWPLSETEAHPR